MKKMMSLFAVLAVAGIVAVGCGKKADSTKPIEEIKKEVETMSVAELESSAKAYVKEIQARKSEVDKVKSKLKELSPKELLGESAKSIKDEITKIGKEVKALTDRYEVYAKEFTSKGGDIAAIRLS